MAVATDSTPAPSRALLPLRGLDGRFARRAELPAEPLLSAEPDTLDAIRRDMDALLMTCEHKPTPGAASHGDITTPSLDAARALHLRRQLAAAVDHGADLLAALGLPRLVEPDFVRMDIHTAGDAIDLAIATLDALDGDPEAEPSLGWTGAAIGLADLGDAFDREAEPEHDEDGADHEPEAGYDLPEGDDERCGSGEVDDEPWLGAPIGDGNQEHWAQGPCGSVVEDDPLDRWYHSRPWPAIEADRDRARVELRRARAIADRIARPAPAPDPDTLTFCIWKGIHVAVLGGTVNAGNLRPF